MRVEATYVFNAPRSTVWSVLIDPEALRSAIPGCERFEALGNGEYEVAIQVGVLGIRGTYHGKATLADLEEPSHYRLVVEGSGGAGGVRGEAVVDLVEQEAGKTEVKVQGNGQVTGSLARFGEGMLGQAAKLLMNQFFGRLREVVASRG